MTSVCCRFNDEKPLGSTGSSFTGINCEVEGAGADVAAIDEEGPHAKEDPGQDLQLQACKVVGHRDVLNWAGVA